PDLARVPRVVSVGVPPVRLSRARPTPFPYTTLFRSRLDGEATEPLDTYYAGPLLAQLKRVVAGTAAWEREAVVASTRLLPPEAQDRKSTRLNSSHATISYAAFCLKKTNCSMSPSSTA